VIGLTGAVGAGKSTAAGVLAGLGCRVLDVDALGHAALDDAGVRRGVGAAFGAEFVDTAGRVDRRALAARVFGDREALARLEGIVHPWVLQRLDELLADARRERPRAIVIDCALLFESGLDARCDTTWVVEAPPAARRARTAARGWADGEFARREAAQLPADAKRERATRTLANDGDLEALGLRAAALLDEAAPAAAERGVGRAGDGRDRQPPVAGRNGR
jgi:dephospho-CoA kinase